MCESGINTGQLKLSIAQTGESLALAQEWCEQLHQLADKGGEKASSAHLAQVTVMLGEARDRLEQASEVIGSGGAGHHDVSVELV
jgi:hypothetical protein